MNNKSFIHNPNELICEAEHILLSEKEDHRFLKKVNAVRLSLTGKSNKQIAEELDITLRTLQLWINAADEKGFDSLRSQIRPGIKPKLSDEQCNELREIVLSSFPFEYGDYATLIWKDSILATLIFNKYQVVLSTRSCRTLLNQFEYHEHLSPYCSCNYIFTKWYKSLGAKNAWDKYKSWMDARSTKKGDL